jgi:hypothetical protein
LHWAAFREMRRPMAASLTPPSRSSVFLGWAYFVASAALAAFGLAAALEAPWVALVLAGCVAGVVVPRVRARRRFRDLVLRGNTQALLAAWGPDTEQEDARTVGPLMRATALAAHGLTDRAKRVLDLAHRGAAWEETLEHRLFLDALLACCEGRFEAAWIVAEAMGDLPLPSSRWERSRAVTLRAATLAMARAFSREATQTDTGWLRLAARQNPLLYWPMRYAEATARLTLGQTARARHLLDGAPAWPEDSAFHGFNRELLEVLASLERVRAGH